MNILRYAVVSWKTTVLGILAFVTALSIALTYVLDGNPDTVPNWDEVINAFWIMLVALMAKDPDKSTEAHTRKRRHG